jgi:hypothetical protein
MAVVSHSGTPHHILHLFLGEKGALKSLIGCNTVISAYF